MIIKILRPTGKDSGWCFFDNCTDVYYAKIEDIHKVFSEYIEEKGYNDSESAREVTNAFLTDTDEEYTIGSIFRTVSEIYPSGWFLSFTRGKHTYELHGDTEVYLLNDLGKTIERI